jgi:hypothetical protein
MAVKRIPAQPVPAQPPPRPDPTGPRRVGGSTSPTRLPGNAPSNAGKGKVRTSRVGRGR